MKTFAASTLLVLAAQLLSISANPVPAPEAANLVARFCSCIAYDNAIAIGDEVAAANAIRGCSTPCPAPASAASGSSSQARSYDAGSYSQQWGDYNPTLWYDSPQCFKCEGKQYYEAGCHCEDCGHLPQPCKPAP